MSERAEQIAVLDWWLLQHPKHYDCLFSIPNGAQLAGNAANRARQMRTLKAEGLKPGVSDLFLMMAKGGFHGLFIEMKAKGKKESALSIPQREHIDLAIEQGYLAVMASGADEAIIILTQYMNGEIVRQS